jgi:GT2 family glycosyltransferase
MPGRASQEKASTMSAVSSDLVSIVIPFYSHPEYLPQALESALGQTYQHLEVIIVDDGSPHNLTPFIQPYLSDSRLRVIRQENRGVAAARNTGVQAAHGAYLQFLDSDDWLASEKIACQVRALEAEPDVGLVFGRFHYVEGNVISEPVDLHRDPLWQPTDGCYFNTLWAANRMVVAGPLVRREWIERAGGFDTTNLTEDYELWLRLAALGCKVRSLPDAHVYYRINPRGRSQDGHARARKVATRARILTLFPELTAEATERAMETWNAWWAALWRSQQDIIDHQQETIGRHAETLAHQAATINLHADELAHELAQARREVESLRNQITDAAVLSGERDAVIAQLEYAPPLRVVIRGLRQALLPIGSRRYRVYTWLRHIGHNIDL